MSSIPSQNSLSTHHSGASYPPSLISRYLSFFNHSVIPALGVMSQDSKWKPNLTWNASAVQVSVTVEPELVARFKIEPIGPITGSADDLFNQILPLTFIDTLKVSCICPELDLEYWHTLTDEFSWFLMEEILLGETGLAVFGCGTLASHNGKLVLRLGQCIFEILAEFDPDFFPY